MIGSRNARLRGFVACGAATLLLTGGGRSTAFVEREGTVREAAALTGSAKLFRSAGDDITFTFDAHLAAADTGDPRKATGTFGFSHYAPGFGGRAEARVDCLMTGGRVAVVTGIVTDTDLEGVRGIRVGVTVHDLPTGDRLGYSWALASSPADQSTDLPLCLSSAPFETIRKGTGDFTVVPWHPAL